MVKFDIKKESLDLHHILQNVYSGKLRITRVIKGAYDENWNKEYETYYSKQLNAEPYVTRIFLKESKTPFGFIHLRPTSEASRISECYLSPPTEMKDERKYFIKCKDFYENYGEIIDCVPFIMPESIISMCTHGSVWICLKILESKTGKEVKNCDMPHIQKLATGSPYNDGEGLFFMQINRLLKMCNCSAFYTLDNIEGLDDDGLVESNKELIFQIYSYIESGLSVIIGVDVKDLKWCDETESGYHSIVVIGHTMNESDVNGFIVHDQSSLPYQVLTETDLLKALHGTDDHLEKRSNIREFVVAVPSEVKFRYEIIYQDYLSFISSLSQLRLIGAYDEETYEHRPILMSQFKFIEHTLSIISLKNINEDIPLILEALRNINASPYYWVFLFYKTKEDRLNKKDVGFFMGDATGDSNLKLIYLKDEHKIFYDLNGKLKIIDFVGKKIKKIRHRRFKKIRPIE